MSLQGKRILANQAHHIQYLYADRSNSINYVDKKYHRYRQHRCA